MLDLRLPSGLFFAITGALLIVIGVTDPSARPALIDTNIDLYAGAVMVGFGLVLLMLARSAARTK